jgi:hypothetical protein
MNRAGLALTLLGMAALCVAFWGVVAYGIVSLFD